jgi:hypothetical protein
MTLRVDVTPEITERGYSAVYYAAGYLIVASILVVI